MVAEAGEYIKKIGCHLGVKSLVLTIRTAIGNPRSSLLFFSGHRAETSSAYLTGWKSPSGKG